MTNKLARITRRCAGALLLTAATSQAHAFAPGIVCETGASDSLCDIQITPSVSLEAQLGSIQDSPDPYRIELTGNVTIVTDAMRLPLLESELVVNTDPEGFELYGSARVPLDQMPLLNKAEFEQVPIMTVGLVQASTISELFDNQLPLNTAMGLDGTQRDSAQPYLLFHADSGMTMKVDNLVGAETGLSFSIPGSQSFTLVIDTLDPYVYLSKSMQASNQQDQSDGKPDTLVVVYEQYDADGNLETTFYEHYDQQGVLVKKYLQSASTGGMIEHAYSDTGGVTVTFYQPDGNGNYRQEGSDGTNGSVLSTSEITEGKRKVRQTAEDNNDPNNNEEESSDPFPIDSIGFSANGWIPYEARTSFGIPRESQRFAGQLFLSGEIPMGSTFVTLEGDVVTYIGEEGYAQGGNGTLSVGFSFLKDIVDFSLELGNATAAVQVSPARQMTYISGELDPDTLFFDDILPIFPKVGARAAGYIDNSLDDAHITIEGEFDIGAEVLGNLIGVNLSKLSATQARMTINNQGVVITGTTSASIHPALELGGQVAVRAELSWLSPEDISLELRGDMSVYGVGLQDVLVSISKQGMAINGAFVTPLTSIGLAGSITNQGPSLTGTASVVLGLGGITQAMNQAVDGINAAQREVNRLSGLIDAARAMVLSERERHAELLQDARNALSAAQSKVNSLNSQISTQYAWISKRKAEIASWKRWLNRAKWYQKASRAARYAYESGWRYADIASRYTKIAALKASLYTAKGILELAKLSLQALENATEVISVDADPRVASLIAAKAIADTALELAKAPLEGIPVIDGDFSGNIEAKLDLSGISGIVTAQFEGYSLLQGTVTFGARPEACIRFPTLGDACTAL